jgi:hypothetical protein
MIVMKNMLLGALLSAVALGAAAGEPKAAAIAVEESEAVVELVSLDRSTRVATVRAANGATLAIEVPKDARNLDRVKPGDRFKMRYVEAAALALHKGGAASATGVQTVELAPKGSTPGGRVVNTRQITALVTAIDRKGRSIAVQGPLKNTIRLKVADEVKSFDEIAVGDTVALTYIEALMLQMIVD